jgi:hypothetical protein
MRIDVQIAFSDDVEIDHAVTRDLVQHVFEERQAGLELGCAVAVQVYADLDLGFLGVTCDLRAALSHGGGSGIHA